jgi:hypothetical protein
VSATAPVPLADALREATGQLRGLSPNTFRDQRRDICVYLDILADRAAELTACLSLVGGPR